MIRAKLAYRSVVILLVDKSIKVIKRRERELLAGRDEAPPCLLKSEIELRREMVRTVASWIVERRAASKKTTC